MTYPNLHLQYVASQELDSSEIRRKEQLCFQTWRPSYLKISVRSGGMAVEPPGRSNKEIQALIFFLGIETCVVSGA